MSQIKFTIILKKGPNKVGRKVSTKQTHLSQEMTKVFGDMCYSECLSV